MKGRQEEQYDCCTSGISLKSWCQFLLVRGGQEH